ncbi:MAG: transposon-encoded TnpW family protein [Oscillospiraceae bacterium]|jgi:hypothetical protein|nr:transposon-encoded TnpW family protein [Oscillospiraceae bacterium]
MECKIGTTTYVTTFRYNQEAKEGLLDKIWRLIRRDESLYQ